MNTNSEINFLVRKCPNCDNAETSVKDQCEVAAKHPAEDADFSEISKRFIGFSDNQIFFSYMRCSNCSILYNSSYFSSDQLDSLYKSMPDNSGGESLGHLSRTQRGYVKNLSVNNIREGNWLDLGADIGLFAAELHIQLPLFTIDAIEPNIDVHQALQENLGPRGVISTDWAGVLQKKYSGISAVHVLDHLVDLKLDLVQIVNHLEVGGVLIAVVHNEKSLLRKLMRSKWPPFCLQHPQLFSRSSLTKTLESAGLTVDKIDRTVNYFTIRHLFSTALSLLGLSPKLGRLTPNIALPLALGNIVVIAHKLR